MGAETQGGEMGYGQEKSSHPQADGYLTTEEEGQCFQAQPQGAASVNVCTSQPRVTQQKHRKPQTWSQDLHSSVAGSAQPCNLSQVMAPL